MDVLIHVAVVAVIVLFSFVAYKCRKNMKNMFSSSDGGKSALLSQANSNLPMRTSFFTTGSTSTSSRKIYLRNLPSYVAGVISEDSGFMFSQEYERVKSVGLQQSKVVALLPKNWTKNRYRDILAYDHSRVKLSSVDDYINANYISGYRVRRAYIATQGPLPSTLGDFWTMVWEQNTHIIVMLTQLVEGGRTKCHRYWPGNKPEIYGEVTVEALDKKRSTHWTNRVFKLTKEKQRRMVQQYQFTSWPDHGVPDTPTPALDFVKAMREKVSPTHGPIVVHCSAGVGRTGTFIALDTLLLHIKDYDWVDIFGIVSEMRQHRNHMVQTEAQYVFIYKAMVEVCKTMPVYQASSILTDFPPV